MFNSGFSLIELLVVLTIISILITLSYPVYNHHLMLARRSEAKIGLLQLASKLENYASLNNHYSGATMESLGMPVNTDDQSYQFTINNVTETSYLIAAVPQGKQAASDSMCGSLLLDEIANKTITGTGNVNECW